MHALTSTEMDLLRTADIEMDNLERAQTSRNQAAITKARRRLEDISAELEKFRDPNAKARELMKIVLRRPIDLCAPLAKAPTPSRKAIDYRSDRFDKLTRARALAK